MTLRQGLIVGVGSLFIGLFCNVNFLNLERTRRDRLMETFMPNKSAIERGQWEPATEGQALRVADLYVRMEEGRARLFHILNCNVVMVDAAHNVFRSRGGDNFFFSPLFSGSSATGWIKSNVVGGRGMSLASAMATSATAANLAEGVTGQGITRNRLVSLLMWFFNVRSGFWLRNPGANALGRALAVGPPNLWLPGLWQGLLGRRLGESAAFVELTDGGYFENTALYELIRRRLKVIILSEARSDSNYRMEDLANAVERARVDFGVHIRFDIQGYEADAIRPRNREGHPTNGYSKRGFALAHIYYPPLSTGRTLKSASLSESESGYLLYLQASKIDGVAKRVDIDGYARAHPEFPNETTADQFVGEYQFEAYRELGLEVAEQAIGALQKRTVEERRAINLSALETVLGIVGEGVE